MRFFKRTLRESKKSIGNGLECMLHPFMEKTGKRMRIAPRVRLLNSKAAKSPKRTFAIVFSTLLLIFLVDLSLTFFIPVRTAPAIRMDIASVDTVFTGFRTIQENKEIHRKAVAEMALSGKDMKNRLDSLIAIPEKSRKDSIEIKTTYRKLERLVEYLRKPGE